MISHWYIVCFVYFGMCLEGFQVIHVWLIEGMIKQIYLLIGLHWVHGIFFSSSCKCHMVRISLDSSTTSWYVSIALYLNITFRFPSSSGVKCWSNRLQVLLLFYLLVLYFLLASLYLFYQINISILLDVSSITYGALFFGFSIFLIAMAISVPICL